MTPENEKKLGWGIGGLPQAQLFDTYQSGTLLEFDTVRYHRKEDGIALTRKGKVQFFAEVANREATVGETNMRSSQQLEKGHWFTIDKIGVKVFQRKPANSAELADKQWYQRVLNTLFGYGVLRFTISGMAHIGEFPLAQLLPAVQSVGQTGGIVQLDSKGSPVSVSTSSNTAPVMAAGVFDLRDRKIKLSEQVNFGVEVEWDIPSRIWDGSENAWRNLDADNDLDLELMQVPDGTCIEVLLIGQEMRMQG